MGEIDLVSEAKPVNLLFHIPVKILLLRLMIQYDWRYSTDIDVEHVL